VFWSSREKASDGNEEGTVGSAGEREKEK